VALQRLQAELSSLRQIEIERRFDVGRRLPMRTVMPACRRIRCRIATFCR